METAEARLCTGQMPFLSSAFPISVKALNPQQEFTTIFHDYNYTTIKKASNE